MFFTTTISRYLGRQFAWWFASMFTSLLGVMIVVDFVELMRRAASKPKATFEVVLDMSLLRVPFLAQELIPFAILFGAMAAFWRLSRSREIVVIRATGVSIWQLILPALLLAFTIGVVKTTVVNPVASVMQSRYEQLENKYLRGRTNLLAVSATGVWLRQADAYGQTVVHAQRVSPRGMEMQGVIVLLFEGTDRFVGRIDAASAKLEDGYWHLRDAWLSGPDRPARHEPEYMIKTDLTIEKIQDSFASPNSISFWDLPAFIRVLENAGFSGLRHRLYWQSLLADPFILSAMVLFAAAFTLRPNLRRGAVAAVIGGGVLTGFLLFFLTDVIFALGLSATIPVMLAAWTPAGISLLIGLSLLLYLEEV